jgi:FkbM family methyltransferase
MFLQAAVKPGDTFVDIGANVGLITLHAAALVGSAGCVHSFEPNPLLAERLRKLIDLNQLNHVTLHAVGLSDAQGELALSILKDHHEQGTLSRIDDPSVFSHQYHVPTRLGDEELPADLAGPAMFKIDVEGHELQVLRGLRRTLDRLRPVVFTEVSDDYLRRAGSSVAELFAFMHLLGYSGYQITPISRMFRRRLRLVKVLDPAKVVDENIAWLHPESPGFGRLENCLN